MLRLLQTTDATRACNHSCHAASHRLAASENRHCVRHAIALARVAGAAPTTAVLVHIRRYEQWDYRCKANLPTDWNHAQLILTACGFMVDDEGCCYFPDDDPGHWAERRVPLNSQASFDTFLASPGMRPAIWVYPRVDGVSPSASCVESHVQTW